MVRDDVLRTLEEHRGEQISGGTLARKLGVSRNMEGGFLSARDGISHHLSSRRRLLLG